jgi:hypothetical protein
MYMVKRNKGSAELALIISAGTVERSGFREEGTA